MNKEGFSSLTTILLALGIVILGGAVWYFSPDTGSQIGQAPSDSGQPPLVGGDRDVHGCIGSAGYQWCEAKQKCLRTWEEYCGSSDLDPAFNALTAIRNSDTGVFGYATSSAFEWRLEGNATTTIQGLAITATGAHNNDYKLADQYFTQNGFTASIPNEAGGPTGGLQGYQKDNLVCTLGFAYTDLTNVPDAPIQVDSDAQYITVSCGNLSAQNPSASQIDVSNWKTYTNTKYRFSVKYPPDWKINDTSSIQNGKQYPAVDIVSPARYNLPNYQNIPAEYRILIYATEGNPISMKQMNIISGFGSPNLSHQSEWNMEVSKNVEEGTNEYIVSRRIVSSFVLIATN